MASTTANVGAGSIAVAVRPVRATSHILTPSFPPKQFATSPANHGLPRTGLKLTKGDTVFSAVMDGMAFRLQQVSLSEESAGQPTASTWASVHTGTCTPPRAFTVNHSVRRKLANYSSKLFARCTQSIRASFKRAALKRAKKTGGASRPPPSQCPPEAGPLVIQGVESIWVGSVLATLEANQHQATQFDQMSSFEVQAPATPAFPPPTSLGGSLMNALPAFATPRNGTTDMPMEEDVEQQDSSHPISPAPTPMELEAENPSTNATLASQSSPTPFESSMGGEMDASVPESADSIMRDDEDFSRETEVIQQTEYTSNTFTGSISSGRVPSTTLGQDMGIEGQDDPRSSTALQPIPTPLVQSTESSSAFNVDGNSEKDTSQGSARTPASAAAIDVEPQEGVFAQRLWTSRIDAAPESRQPAQAARNEEAHATQCEVALTQSHGLVPTSTGTSTSVDSPPVATPSSTPSSTAGPSTPTQSPQSSSTPGQGQPTQTHAARLHQALSKWGSSKQASKISQRAVGEGASEEADAEALVAKYKATAHPPVQTSNPRSLPNPPEPKRTKGSAARSLMDDLMAGFRGATKPTASRQQAPAVAHPPTQPNPSTPNHPPSSFVVQNSPPVVAGRQSGPRPIPPQHIGIGSGVAAPGGSAIQSRSAPSTVPMSAGEVNGPSGRNAVRAGPSSEAVPPMSALEPSNVAMGDAQFGGRIVKGSKRVARATAATGSTWQSIQQKAREAQAALDREHSIAATAPTPTNSLKAYEEYARSSAWHRAQPPPPPEAMAYVSIGGKPCRGAPECSSRGS